MHIGPMAEDFGAAFGENAEATHIPLVDAYGVAMAAIQALEARQRVLLERLSALEAELAGAGREESATEGEPRPSREVLPVEVPPVSAPHGWRLLGI